MLNDSRGQKTEQKPFNWKILPTHITSFYTLLWAIDGNRYLRPQCLWRDLICLERYKYIIPNTLEPTNTCVVIECLWYFCVYGLSIARMIHAIKQKTDDSNVYLQTVRNFADARECVFAWQPVRAICTCAVSWQYHG